MPLVSLTIDDSNIFFSFSFRFGSTGFMLIIQFLHKRKEKKNLKYGIILSS